MILPYRNIYALFKGFLAEEAHECYGEKVANTVCLSLLTLFRLFLQQINCVKRTCKCLWGSKAFMFR